jgi:hypothetical protein
LNQNLLLTLLTNFSGSAIPDPLTLSILATLNTSSTDCQPVSALDLVPQSGYLVKAQ